MPIRTAPFEDAMYTVPSPPRTAQFRATLDGRDRGPGSPSTDETAAGYPVDGRDRRRLPRHQPEQLLDQSRRPGDYTRRILSHGRQLPDFQPRPGGDQS